MKRAALLFALLSLMVFIPCTRAQQRIDVSLVRLIANPREYDGKHVRVIGFVRLEFEGNAIYLHREDEKYGITKNALWLSLSREEAQKWRALSDNFVLVEGTFDANSFGHMGLFSGTIKDIKRFQRWAKDEGDAAR